MSGPAGFLGIEMRDGLLTGFERANRTGGIHGRRLRLKVLDDGYEPARTSPNMRQLIEQDKVIGIVGNVGTPTGIAALPIALETKTLFFAPFSGAGAFRPSKPNPYVVNYRASYAEEISAVVDALIGGAGLHLEEVALFTQRDAYGDAGYAGCIAAMKRWGLKNESAVLHVRYERNTLGVEGALATLLYADREPRAVIMIGAYAPCAKFVKLARKASLNAVFHSVSFVGTQPLAKELGDLNAPIVVTQVVPFPQGTNVTLVHDYLEDLHAAFPGLSPTFGSLEGYSAARILLIALERIAGPPNKENLVASINSLGEFDLGLGTPLRLDAREHQASHAVWLTQFKDGAFHPIQWPEFTGLISEIGEQCTALKKAE